MTEEKDEKGRPAERERKQGEKDEKGRPAEAVKTLTSFGSRVQESPIILVNLGRAYLKLGETDKGLQDLEHAGVLVHENDPLLLLLARIFLSYGEVDEADRLVERCGPTLQGTAEYHLVLGHLLLDVGSDPVEIVSEFQEALRLDPKNQEAVESLLALMQSLEDGAMVETVISSLPKRILNTSRTRLLVGEVRARFGQWQEAMEAAKRVVQFDPNNERAWLLLARAQEALGQSRSAEVSFRRALRSGGRTPAVAVEYARVLLDRNQERKALRFLMAAEENQKNLPVSERSPAVHNLLAAIYARRGQMPLAREQLRLSLELQPNQPDIQRLLDTLAGSKIADSVRDRGSRGQPVETNRVEP